MNDLQSFSAEAAKTFSDLAAQKRDKELTKKADNIIAKIDSKYEKAIKRELSITPDSRYVKIGLGFFGVPNTHDLNDIEVKIRNHYKDLGFNVSLMRGKSCGCIFDIVCNHNQLYVHITW